MIDAKIKTLNWARITEELHSKGYARIEKLLTPEQCEALIQLYEEPKWFRKTVVMERHRFGQGEYKYFGYPLPEHVQELRTALYRELYPIANSWMKALGIPMHYPASLGELQEWCAQHGQEHPTPLLLKYGQGGFNTLHQDLYGTVYFPMQAVFVLTEPGQDYLGGELVLTQQQPRSQSKAIVLHPKRGDMVLFATRFRPIKGARGYYRAQMRHGVSEVLQGNRHSLGIIFHDAEH